MNLLSSSAEKNKPWSSNINMLERIFFYSTGNVQCSFCVLVVNTLILFSSSATGSSILLQKVMGFSKEQLLARLKVLSFIIISQHALLFLMMMTIIHLHFHALLFVLSQRLGLGKGGLRMAPAEALGEILQVPLGCVTLFALVNESARGVSRLLDQGFMTQEHCFFHPLSNDMSISLNAHDLDKFLKSIGKDPSYVDFEANPAVGKYQPPDLAALVPSSSIAMPYQPEKQPSSEVPTDGNQVSVNNKSEIVSAQVIKPSVSKKNYKGDTSQQCSFIKLLCRCQGYSLKKYCIKHQNYFFQRSRKTL